MGANYARTGHTQTETHTWHTDTTHGYGYSVSADANADTLHGRAAYVKTAAVDGWNQ